MYDLQLKNKSIALYKRGLSYEQIRETLQRKVPKSTLATWFKSVSVEGKDKLVIQRNRNERLMKSRSFALLANKRKRELFLSELYTSNAHLGIQARSKSTATICLALLYLTEGSKTGGKITFGNSDPRIIGLFLELLRLCYTIDEAKLRCTVQCRADQDVEELSSFWAKVTNIPLNQFYKAQIDMRSLGKPTKKPGYKGVCRIDYFSGRIFAELDQIIKIITEGP